jgi:hypothetical protein
MDTHTHTHATSFALRVLITLMVKAWRIVERRHVAPFQDARFLVRAVSRAVRHIHIYMPKGQGFRADSNRARDLWTVAIGRIVLGRRELDRVEDGSMDQRRYSMKPSPGQDGSIGVHCRRVREVDLRTTIRDPANHLVKT